MHQIWTVGHWTCPELTFIDLLRAEQIELLVDVRAHPGSRRSPQFSRDVMPEWLHRAQIEYLHMPQLGGRRTKQDVAAEINSGWQNLSFRNYADFSLSEDYEQGIEALTEVAQAKRSVVMCAEPMPWRCHRLLISNTLKAQGWSVFHIMAGSSPRVHELGQWGATPVVSSEGQVTYPA